MKIFIPKIYLNNIFSIDYNKLKNDGYKLIIFDLDNTIGDIKQEICDIKTEKFLNKLNQDFIVLVASNSRKKRVEKFCENLKCDRYYFSLKPTMKILYKIKKKYNVDYKKMVIVGDQLLTDIVLGNRKGLLTILIDPIKNKDRKVTILNRKIENLLKKKYNIKRGEFYS